MNHLLIVGISIIALIVIFSILFKICYKTSATNQVRFVTGGALRGPFVVQNKTTHTKVKVVKAGGTWVWPIIQRSELYDLNTFNIDVNVSNIMTKTIVPINVSANAVLRPGSSPELLAIASEKILGLSKEERENQLEQVVLGGLRGAIASMSPEAAIDRSSFADTVSKDIKETFNNMGLELVSFQITQLNDNNDYYTSIAAIDIAKKRQAKREAEATSNNEANKVEAKKEQETLEAQAEAHKQAKLAQLKSDQIIAKQNRDTEVAKAEYQAEVNKKQAQAENAKKIANAEQEAIIQEKRILSQKNAYQADMKTKADAEAEQIKTLAEANYVKKQKEADAIAYQTSKNGEAEAKAIKSVGEAKAESQKKMADSLNKNGGDKALVNQLIQIMPQLVQASADSWKNIDNITMFDGANSMNKNVTAPIAQAFDTIKKSTGLDMVDIIQKRAEGTTTIKGSVPTTEENK